MDKFDEIGKGEPCKTCWFGPVFPSCIKIVRDCGSHNKWHGYKPKGEVEERDDTGDLIGDIMQDVWDAEANPELARGWIAKRLAARRPSGCHYWMGDGCAVDNDSHQLSSKPRDIEREGWEKSVEWWKARAEEAEAEVRRLDLVVQDYMTRAEKAEAEARTLAQEIIDYRTWTVPGPRKENARKVFDHALAILEAGKEE